MRTETKTQTKTETTTRNTDVLEELDLDADIDVEIVKQRVEASGPKKEEATEEPKSLYELWVENGYWFPFTAVKVCETNHLLRNTPVGSVFTFCGEAEHGYFTETTGSWRVANYIKAWRFG